MDRLEAARTLIAVVDAGSFVAAADHLKSSKAVVSRLVAQLEQHLGVRLLHRTTRRLSLTVEGEAFVSRARELLVQWQEAEDDVSHRSAKARGVLRVNVPVSYGIRALAPLWPGFMKANPDVLLDITLSDRITDLVDEGYDLAVRIGNLPSSSLVSRRLGSARMILCASPSYVKKAGAPTRPSDLTRHRVISYSLLSSGDLWSLTSTNPPLESTSVRVSPQMRSNNGDTCRAAALEGQGIVLQPDFLVEEDVRAKRLVRLLPDWQANELGIHAVYPSRRHLSAKVRLLVDHLVKNMAP
jgi:DNA-binding transcriptional LysR family regulator